MNEQIEKMNLIKTLFIDHDEMSLKEKIEEYEEKLDYLDMPNTKKNKIRKICTLIRKEDSEEEISSLLEKLKNEVK